MDSLSSISLQINNNYSLKLENGKENKLVPQNNSSVITGIVLPIFMVIGAVFTLVASAAAATFGQPVLAIVMSISSVVCFSIGLSSFGCEGFTVRRIVSSNPIIQLNPEYRYRKYNRDPWRARNAQRVDITNIGQSINLDPWRARHQ